MKHRGRGAKDRVSSGSNLEDVTEYFMEETNMVGAPRMNKLSELERRNFSRSYKNMTG